jgi:hypothetical protein
MTEGEWRYIKPNNLQELWDKWGKAVAERIWEEKGLKGRPQYRYFSKIAIHFLDLLLERTIEEGEDVPIPYFGTKQARQVKHHNFRNSVYGRNFTFLGGRVYDIYDLLKKGNKYPCFTFKNNGGVKYRGVYWRSYIRLKHKWRHRLYQKFYDEGMEYKNLRYLSEAEWKRKQQKVIWRNGMVLKFKHKENG